MLSDFTIRQSKPAEKPYKITDSAGLHLYVKPNGSKLWRMRYRFGNKEKMLSFGPYPSVSLTQARKAREDAKDLLRNGKDPSLVKKQLKAVALDDSIAFRNVAEGWLNQRKEIWKSKKHFSTIQKSLEKDVYPHLGALPIPEITSPMILSVLQKLEKKGARETAHRVRARLASIYSYAIASGLTDKNPAAGIEKALMPVKKGKQPAITDLKELQCLIKTVEEYPANIITLLALRFLALTATRSGEVRGMEWVEIKDKVWEIPAQRMKMGRIHSVPLSNQALEIIDFMKQISGRNKLVFPSPRSPEKPMSDNTLSILLRRSGYEGRHVPHGFRASFSSIMNEKHPKDRAIIDKMLAHENENAVEAAYNRAEHLERRAELAQDWADILLYGAKSITDLLESRK